MRESEYNRGTGCGKTARPGLCRGRRVTGVPTAEISRKIIMAGGRHPHPEALYYHIAGDALEMAKTENEQFRKAELITPCMVFSALCLEAYINQAFHANKETHTNACGALTCATHGDAVTDRPSTSPPLCPPSRHRPVARDGPPRARLVDRLPPTPLTALLPPPDSVAPVFCPPPLDMARPLPRREDRPNADYGSSGVVNPPFQQSVRHPTPIWNENIYPVGADTRLPSKSFSISAPCVPSCPAGKAFEGA